MSVDFLWSVGTDAKIILDQYKYTPMCKITLIQLLRYLLIMSIIN